MTEQLLATQVVPFDTQAHLGTAVEALLRLRSTDSTYPPKSDVEASPKPLAEWLMDESVLGRWVALVDGVVVGHISITLPHSYLERSLDDAGSVTAAPHGFCEVSKFFTDPTEQGRGIGSALFHAARSFAQDKGYCMALAVIHGSTAARRFYTANGMREVHEFHGFHGLNHVFVDSQADTGI